MILSSRIRHLSTYTDCSAAASAGARCHPARTWRKADFMNLLLLVISALTLLGGWAASQFGDANLARWIWIGGIAPNVLALLVDCTRSLLRRQAGVDLLALLSIGFALWFGEWLIASVITLMLASGRMLESYAQARAQREITALLAHAPKRAHRFDGQQWQDIDLADVRVGDQLMVRHGEIVPVDGTLSHPADLDESTLTGEAAIRKRAAGEAVSSGVLNSGAAVEMIAGATAEHSTFAGIVRMVEAAQKERSPGARLADRYAVAFMAVAVLLAAAGWIWTGDPLRSLAVLVVATPCPLILAVPTAIVSGMSRCAKRGVLVKGGGALERLAVANTLFFDKTGTLTSGRAHLAAVDCAPSFQSDEILRLAGSVACASTHVISDAIAVAARERGLQLAPPANVREVPGSGVQAMVGGLDIKLGAMQYVLGTGDLPSWAGASLKRMRPEGASTVFLSIDGRLAGLLQFLDGIRLEAPRALRMLRELGIQRQAMLTGDQLDMAQSVGEILGITEVFAEQSPADKLDKIKRARASGTVIMIGDGTNDAPALAAADVGVAMGARGAASTVQAADVVLLVDRFDRLVDAVTIARGTRRIAWQSVMVGMSLSFLGMLVALAGYLPPFSGAVLQEVIDVAVILNALRALRLSPAKSTNSLPATEVARLQHEHVELGQYLDQIRTLAATLPQLDPGKMKSELAAVVQLLAENILPHERDDDWNLYPGIARRLGGEDPLAALSAVHREIFRTARQLDLIVREMHPSGPDSSEIREVQRLLYGLEAILRLHYSQENELFHVLGEAPG